MTNIKEQIRTEIERRKEENGNGSSLISHIKEDEDDMILFLIDSLPDEQPSKDLEKEVRTYCGSSFRFNYDELNDSFYSHAFEFDDVVELARHFYELGKQSKEQFVDYTEELKKCKENPLYFYDKYVKVKLKSDEPSREGLEEAAEEYTQRMLESWRFDSTGCRPPRESFIAGAKWQKEQMLKEGIEGELQVVTTKAGWRHSFQVFAPYDGEIYTGQKVIIIVKEDEK